AARQIAAVAARLLQDQQAGRDVPPVELELPEAVEAPARHVAEVERGAAVAPHAAGALHRSPEEVEVVALRVAHVVGETGASSARPSSRSRDTRIARPLRLAPPPRTASNSSSRSGS